MKPITEAHLAIFRRHMVEVMDVEFDLLADEIERPRLQEALTAATASLERHGMRDWELGELPRAVALPGTGGRVRAYPALVDEDDAVGVRALESAAAQRAAMAAGTRRLLRLTVPGPERWVRSKLATADQLALATAPHGSLAALLEDATQAALDVLVGAGALDPGDLTG